MKLFDSWKGEDRILWWETWLILCIGKEEENEKEGEEKEENPRFKGNIGFLKENLFNIFTKFYMKTF